MKITVRKGYVLHIISCIAVLVLLGCATGGGNRANDPGTVLKKVAMEEKAAADSIRYEEKKKGKPDHLALARTLVEKGFYDVALGQLKEAEKEDKKNPEIFYLNGVCCREKKRYSKAISLFKKAVSMNPEYSYAHDGMGVVYDLTGKHQKAVVCYRKAIELNPAGFGFYNNLGFSLMSAGEVAGAVENFKKSLSLNPGFVNAINNLGLAYGLLGKDDRALTIFKRAGDEAGAYNNMGYVYELRDDLEGAAEMYAKAAEIDPKFKLAKANLRKVKTRIWESGE